jgi:predicted phage tail protein
VVEVVQPSLGPIDTGSTQPAFAASGVPTGAYRVQVRSLNPLGVSGPSNAVDVVVGSTAPCAPPSAPALPTATFANGVATVGWAAVSNATSYVVRAGSQPGGADLFNGNVGNATTVSASGLPSAFSAYVRVYAVNACGTSSASPEIAIAAAGGQ